MVYLQDLIFKFLFLLPAACFPVLFIIVIGIWTDAHLAQKPADAVLLLMSVNKLVLF